ncbi:hypothetical protein L3Q82_022659 [Scortum barcoo]|uniref:Uncharacterized protein n=1 Tax=Scortum barcoo TaxID=214431 RepID=A0ACB8WWL3_9TELE|nr:hypothetical protein L3Q82_022659 [Scortum barcoo]
MILNPVLTDNITEDIEVLVFLPQNNSYLFSHTRVAPAILYAQQRLKTDGGQYSGFHFNIQFENSDCENCALFLLVDNRSCDQKPDLILGPVFEYEAAAVVRLASHWNIPVISAGALAAAFNNKNTEFSHLTRISPSYVKMAETFTAMFEHFTWKSAILVYEDDKVERNCYFTLEGVHHLMSDFNVKTYAIFPEDRLDTDDILQNIYDTEDIRQVLLLKHQHFPTCPVLLESLRLDNLQQHQQKCCKKQGIREEIQVDLLIYMSLVSLPSLQDYWRQNHILSVTLPAKVMTRDRFRSIFWNIHLSDPEEEIQNDRKKVTPGHDKLFRVRPLYDDMACQTYYHPRTELAVDERMVATKAKTGMKQSLKDKPTKWGLTFFVLAESSGGYTIQHIHWSNVLIHLLQFPVSLKTSIIVPVPKKSDVTCLNDYRPVALTPVIMKCFEMIDLKHIKDIIPAGLDQYQFACIQGEQVDRGCSLSIALHTALTHLQLPNTYVRMLFVDFSSAFNTVIPDKLILKLHNLGLPSSLCHWIRDFLTNRPQVVRIGDNTSSTLVLSTGTPQGCMLSPALFTLFTSDCSAIHYHKHDLVIMCMEADKIREIMLAAHRRQLTNSNHMFFNVELFNASSYGNGSWKRGDKYDNDARQAYASLNTVTLLRTVKPEFENFSMEMKKSIKKAGFHDCKDCGSVNMFVEGFHDAMLLYAIALHEAMKNGYSKKNGTEITSRMWNRTFEGQNLEALFIVAGDFNNANLRKVLQRYHQHISCPKHVNLDINTYTDTVVGYIGKCINDIVPMITMMKPWVNREIRAKLKAWTDAYNSEGHICENAASLTIVQHSTPLCPPSSSPKLRDLRLNTTIRDWILNFLSDRPQAVGMGSTTSSTLTLNTGAPQGCVLSPLLHSLFMHDCMATRSFNTIIKFGDDMTVISLITGDDETAYTEEVRALTSWCQDNNLHLNFSKTKGADSGLQEEAERGTRPPSPSTGLWLPTGPTALHFILSLLDSSEPMPGY